MVRVKNIGLLIMNSIYLSEMMFICPCLFGFTPFREKSLFGFTIIGVPSIQSKSDGQYSPVQVYLHIPWFIYLVIFTRWNFCLLGLGDMGWFWPKFICTFLEREVTWDVVGALNLYLDLWAGPLLICWIRLLLADQGLGLTMSRAARELLGALLEKCSLKLAY